MKYYKLTPTTDAWQRRIQSVPLEAAKHIKIDSGINEKLDLELIFKDLSAEGGIQYRDLGYSLWHDWPGPNAFVWVVSEEFHLTLERFRHNHLHFVPVPLKMGEEEQQYYLYYLFGHPMANLAFSEMSFQVILDGEEIETLKKGEVMTFEDYRNKINELRKDKPKARLKSNLWVYDRHYDIVWGNPFVILLSQSVVDLIDNKLNYKDQFFLEEFKEYEITTK